MSDEQSWTSARAVLANRARRCPDDLAAIEDARRDLKVARATAYIRKLVSEAPPLSAEQRDRLALLLHDAA